VTNERQGNVAASVRQQLLDLSRERREDFQLILTWYAAERFLYRLALSKYSKQFILKGAMLLNVWMDRDKVTQWKAFLTRTGLENTAVDLPQIIEELKLFIIPLLQTAASGGDFNLEWTRGGPWSTVGGKD
jgi:hypothetical protein